MSRTLATVRLYGAILWLLVAVLAEAIRETLPSDEREAGVFLAGMTWAFVLFWTFLILVTYLWSVAR